MQAVRFTEKDGRELFWSEAHVSEDFDMALRLQTAGFIVRLATYGEWLFHFESRRLSTIADVHNRPRKVRYPLNVQPLTMIG